jgi:hypothetical protein
VTKCDEKRRAPRAAINLGESPSRRHMAPHSKRLKNFAKVTKSKICRQNRYVMVRSHAAKVRFLIARSTPWCIPGFIASTVVCCRTAPHHPPECGCRRRGRVSAVAAPHTVPVFRRVPAGCADPPDAPLVCACTPIVNPSVVATMSAVRISVPPCYYGAVVRLTVNRCADEERRELLRCIGRTFDFVLHERESNSPA